MKKKILISILTCAMVYLSCWSIYGQDAKLRVAVFDPTSSSTSIDEGTRVAVRELISATLVNTGKYIIVERSLLQQVMNEQKFSNTDLVDENQATELGRLAGANKVVLSVVTLVGGRNMLSIKIIDVETATIDQQKTRIVNTSDLLDIVEPLTLNMIGEKTTDALDDRNNGKANNGNAGNNSNRYDNSNSRSNNNSNRYDNSNSRLSRNNDSGSVFACGLEIQADDLYNDKVVWKRNICPDGWRLPTREELKSMCKEQRNIGNFKTNAFSYYFTGEFNKKGEIYTRSFDDCKESTGDLDREMAWVRCVKDN